MKFFNKTYAIFAIVLLTLSFALLACGPGETPSDGATTEQTTDKEKSTDPGDGGGKEATPEKAAETAPEKVEEASPEKAEEATPEPTVEKPPAEKGPAPTVNAALSKDKVKAGEKLTVTIETKNFFLDAANIGKAPKAGSGHYHVYLDGNTGLKYLAAGAGDKEEVTIPAGTTAGPHTIRVSLRENDHSALNPKVEKILKFTVEATPPPPASVDAKLSTTTVEDGGKIEFDITAKNFKLDASQIGKAPKPGVGHYHIYLDKNTGLKYLTAGAGAKVSITIPKGTSPGAHTLRLSLRQNDHSELNPKVEKIFNITVKAANPSAPSVDAILTKNSVAPGGKLEVSITVKNFKLDASQIGKAPKKGVGHYHIYLDNNSGLKYLAAGVGLKVSVVIPAGTSAGAHTLKVSLRENDHSELSPKVEKILNFTVSSTTKPPTLSIKANKTTVKPGDKVTFTLTVGNFKLDASKIGKAKKAGEGHYHVYGFGKTSGANYLAAGVTTTVTITIPATAKPGKETITIELRNNDHSSLSPKVEDKVDLTVQASTPTFKCSAKYAGCSSFTDLTASGAKREITFKCCSYAPKCIKIKVGQSVTFKGSFGGHPLKAKCEEVVTIKETRTGSSATFKFTKAGYYNYYCIFHDSGTGTGMAGNVYVVP